MNRSRLLLLRGKGRLFQQQQSRALCSGECSAVFCSSSTELMLKREGRRVGKWLKRPGLLQRRFGLFQVPRSDVLVVGFVLDLRGSHAHCLCYLHHIDKDPIWEDQYLLSRKIQMWNSFSCVLRHGNIRREENNHFKRIFPRLIT